MEKVNVVILAEEVQYRVKVKNKIVNEDVAIVGYSDFKEESKLKIEGYFPDVIVCALEYELLIFIGMSSYASLSTEIFLSRY